MSPRLEDAMFNSFNALEGAPSAELASTGPTESPFLIDSGCSNHMTWRSDIFTRLRKSLPRENQIHTANGELVDAIGIGTISISLQTGSPRESILTLRNVLLVEGLHTTLLSVSQLDDPGIHKSVIQGKGMHLKNSANTPPFNKATKTGGLYVLLTTKPPELALGATTSSSPAKEAYKHWHRRLAHLSEKSTKEMHKYADDVPQMLAIEHLDCS